QMHVDYLLPVGGRHLVDHRRAGHAGVIDQRVDPAEGGHAGVHGPLREGGVGHVAGQRHTTLGAQRGAQPGQRLGVQVDRHHAAAQVGDGGGQGPSDALPGPGHDDLPVFQCEKLVLHLRMLRCQIVSSAPSTSVAWLENSPPLPCASASRAPATCRSPAVPASCWAASTMVNSPYMPGCTHDRPPPLVLTGSCPPGAMRPPSTKAAPSPLAQKPKSSRNKMVLRVKASYSSTTSKSAGLTPACAMARGPLSDADVTVRSGMLVMSLCQAAAAPPSR